MAIPIMADVEAAADCTQAVQILEIGIADESPVRSERGGAPDEPESHQQVGTSQPYQGDSTPENAEEPDSLAARLRRRFSPG